MTFIPQDVANQLREVFMDLKQDVTIALFTTDGCYSCEETTAFMTEVADLSDKLHFVPYDFAKDHEKANAYDVTMVPSIVLLDHTGAYRRIKFNGIPAGHEINAFIPALLEVSGNESALPEDIKARIEAISKPINIKVFVTLSCPHCSGAVQKAHKMAMMNPMIQAEMIEAQTFDELSNRFNVSGVPKIVINDQYELVGNQPLQAFLQQMEQI